jgi:hypothetical protein
MRRILVTSALALGGWASCAATGEADVIIRGPFGGTIVVASPADVRVGPGVVVGSPVPRTAVMPVSGKATSAEPPIVSTSRPVVRPDLEGDVLPPPKVLKTGMTNVQPGIVVNPLPQPVIAPIVPRDFAKTFRPGPEPAKYEVLFLHPVSRQPVSVCFDLPPGCPRVSYCCNRLVFDYGRHEVEIRFKLGGRVVVTQR